MSKPQETTQNQAQTNNKTETKQNPFVRDETSNRTVERADAQSIEKQKNANTIQGISADVKEAIKSENKQEQPKQQTKEELISDYENSIKRLQADFENYIKRTEKEKQDFAKYTSAKTISKFLNILDSLDMAMIILEKENHSEIKTGIQMIHKQFHKILEDEGVKPMSCKNQKFDPYCHEIIDMVEHESEEGTIVDELQKGYNLHEKVLRTAKVRVSKGKKKEGAK